MAAQTVAQLYAKWLTGYQPTQQDYRDLFDSFVNFQDHAGTGPQLTTGTDSQIRSWSAQVLADYVTSRLGDVMTKTTYDTNDDGTVNSAAAILGVDTAGNGVYYGTDGAGNPGFYELPNGTGDMTKIVYDANDDGKVDAADAADALSGAAGAGNSKYYGTNGAGTPGFYDLPVGGTLATVNDLTLTFAASFSKHQAANGDALDGPITINPTGAQYGNVAWVKYNGLTPPTISGPSGVQLDQQVNLAENFVAGQDLWLKFLLMDISGTPVVVFSMALAPQPNDHKVLPFLAADFTLGTGSPSKTVATVSGRTADVLRFPVSGANEKAWLWFPAPGKMVSGSTLRARIGWTAPGTGTASFLIRGASVPDAAAMFTAPYGQDVGIMDDLVAADGYHQTRTTADLDILGTPAPDRLICIELEVDTATTTDTLTHVDVLWVEIQYEQAAAIAGKWTESDDTTAPSVAPVLSLSNVTTSSMQLDWTAAVDDVAITQYEVWRSTDGTVFSLQASLGNVLTYTDSTLSDGTQYWYRVRARDAAGNPSTDSNVVNDTTPAASFSGVMLGITAHTTYGCWSLLRNRYSGTEAFEMRRNSDAATEVILWDANGRPDQAQVETFLGGPLTNGALAAKLVRIIGNAGGMGDLEFGWTVGSVTSLEPVLHWDATAEKFGAAISGGASNTAPLGRAGYSPIFNIPQPAIWFDVFKTNSRASVARLRDKYIGGAQNQELVLHSAVNPFVNAGGSLLTPGSYTDNVDTYWVSTHDGANSTLRVDGVAEDGPQNAGSNDMDGLVVGGLNTLTGGYPDAILYEIMCIDGTNITLTDIQAVEAAQAADLV